MRGCGAGRSQTRRTERNPLVTASVPPAASNSRSINKGPSAFDRRFRYVGNFNYNVPLGKGQRWLNRGGILNAVLGNYTLSWTCDACSGNPISWADARI